jgi:hypothetical protein
MKTISHIVHPGIVPRTSDLAIAQPITFETMRIAAEFSKKNVKVSLFAVQIDNEERVPLPTCFSRTRDLHRTIDDIKTFKNKKPFALIRDILDILYQASPAEYFIYTNVDIALLPFFYQTISTILDSGFDAFVINRRTINDKYTSIEDIPFMYAQVGEIHKGYDCFVFRRDLYPKFKLDDICIGSAWVGRALLANLVTFSNKFREFKNKHVTFHIGDSMTWRRNAFKEYFQHNWEEYVKIFNQLESENGAFDPEYRSYLLDAGVKRRFPKFPDVRKK